MNVACLCNVRTGVVTLLKDYEVCKQGDVLTPEQTRILVSSGLFNSVTENRGHVPPFSIKEPAITVFQLRPLCQKKDNTL